MNRSRKPGPTIAVALAFVTLLFAAPVFAENANDIIALAKAQWAAETQNKPSAEAMVTIADDYTEFNADAPTLVEGKRLASEFYDASLRSGNTGLVSEMLNPHVQFYGDVAILTYNFMGMKMSKDGKVATSVAKSTRVYAKKDGKWMLVHANFAPVVAPKS